VTPATELVLFSALPLLLLALVALGAGAAAGLLLGRRRPEPGGEVRETLPNRELEAISAIANELARTRDVLSAGRVLLDEISGLFHVEFTALALVDDTGRGATGLLARLAGEDVDWWKGIAVDLVDEPSGIASAVFDAAPVTVYDVPGSSRVSPRLAALSGVKSAVWIPLISEERVIGVVIVATTTTFRAFTAEEMSFMQALGAEAALALDRTRSAAALGEALERERLVATMARRFRAELDHDLAMQSAVEQAGPELRASRCYVRLSNPGRPGMRVGAEWDADGVEPIRAAASRFPVPTLVEREGRTIAIEDVETTPLFQDEPDSRALLVELGARSVLATPIVASRETIGVLGFHRPEPGAWAQGDVLLAEAVARELGVALQTARLLGENQRRLEQQAALLQAAKVVTSELRLETVLERLVEEVAKLLRADAADCYLVDTAHDVLRCAAVHGLDPRLVGYECPTDRGVAGHAIREGRPVAGDDYDRIENPIPHPAYGEFRRALVAPMIWSGETRGVLGVGLRDGERTFDQDDTELLEAFAGLASLALRNAENFEQRSRQAQIQRGFYGIATVLGEPLSREETLDAAAQAAGEALGGSFAAVLMPGPSGLELAGGHDLPAPLAEALREELPQSAHALATAASERRVLAARMVADDERFDADWRELAVDSGYTSLLAIPVEAPRADEDGLAIVFFVEERAFTDDDLELARQLARAARGALERSELYEAERSSRALSQQLARTSSLLATELDPVAVLEEVAVQAPALLGVEACSIRALDGDDLVVTAASGEGAAEALGTIAPATSALAGEIVQTRLPIAIANVEEDGRPLDGEPVVAAGYRSYLGVPLAGPEGTLYGVLAVYGLRPRTWRDEEVEALVALAGNASAAMANAELYQRIALEREQSVAILANIADGIVAVDREGHVVLWNNAAVEITGVPREEAMGRTPAQVLQRTLEAGGEASAGNRLVSITRGGEEIWLSLTEAIMRDPAGAVAGRIFAFRDISAERLVEQMKSEFVSTVSQRLRAPLTSIYGFAETLLRQDVMFGDEERATFVGYIASEAERLTTIVDALLNVARLDTGDLRVDLAKTDVGSVVSEVVEGANAAEGREFVVQLEDGPLEAEADSDKLRQILDQLLENAVRFSPSGGKVTVAARRRADAVEVSVADEGPGVPAGERQRIFSKFYRADGAREAGGTGLGLFIAQGLVAAMGGKIWVESTEGEGASFVFDLPLARERE